MTKVFIVGQGKWPNSYSKMWEEQGHTIVKDINEANILQFTGGEDVSPHLYGSLPHPLTFSSERRDEAERAILQAKEGSE